MVELPASRSVISGTSAKKRQTPLMKNLTYYEEQRLQESPKFTRTEACQKHGPTTEQSTTDRSFKLKPERSSSKLEYAQQITNSNSRHTSLVPKCRLQQLLVAAGMSQLHASSLTEQLWRLLSPKDCFEKIRLGQVAALIEIASENVSSKLKCTKLLNDAVENYLSQQNVSCNKIMLDSHTNALFEFLVRMEEPGLGMLSYRFKPYLDRYKEDHAVMHRSLNKCRQLFEESKSRSRRKQQRQHQRILKTITENDLKDRTTNYQETLKLFQSSLYNSKKSCDPNKSSRKATKKQPLVKPNKYSKLHATNARSKHPHLNVSVVLFELNIRIDGRVANVQILAGESPAQVVNKLRSEFDISPDLEAELRSMIQQYLEEHHAPSEVSP